MQENATHAKYQPRGLQQCSPHSCRYAATVPTDGIVAFFPGARDPSEKERWVRNPECPAGAARLKNARSELAQFLRDNGLRQDDSRERVQGFGRREAVGDVIHEYGHALEYALRLWNIPEYLSIRAAETDLAAFSKVVYNNSTFTKPIYRLVNDKFVSEYQGMLYHYTDGQPLDISMLREYFSGEYRCYYMNAWTIKKKDRALYEFIRRIT